MDADTPYYVNGDLSATDVEPQNWNAYFDAGSSTLYLNNLSISGYYKYHDSYYWTTGLLARRDLTISVSGTNTIRTRPQIPQHFRRTTTASLRGATTRSHPGRTTISS
ncbi:MAG: hypothetical protein ACLR23_20450 [Clostridia bacterium]